MHEYSLLIFTSWLTFSEFHWLVVSRMLSIDGITANVV